MYSHSSVVSDTDDQSSENLTEEEDDEDEEDEEDEDEEDEEDEDGGEAEHTATEAPEESLEPRQSSLDRGRPLPPVPRHDDPGKSSERRQK